MGAHYPAGQEPPIEALDAALHEAVLALEASGLPYLLFGGIGTTVLARRRGTDDIDVFVRPDDARAALAALAAAGFETHEVDPSWLFKAYRYGVLVDLIFRPSGGPVDDAYFERASELEVVALPLLVSSTDDVLAAKLLAMTEQDPDYRPVLEIARALREQIDWQRLRERVDESPFGAAFFTLAERLRIVPDARESDDCVVPFPTRRARA